MCLRAVRDRPYGNKGCTVIERDYIVMYNHVIALCRRHKLQLKAVLQQPVRDEREHYSQRRV